MMFKQLVIIVTLGLVVGCATPQVSTSDRLDSQISELKDGATLTSFLDRFGSVFDVEEEPNGYRLIVYRLHAKSSPVVFVPVVNLVASGNGHIVQRCVLTFSADDVFDGQPKCDDVEGFTNVYAMPANEGMSGTTGRRDESAYERLGKFLASKGQFFNQESWKRQNIANNYYQKYVEK